MFTLPRPRITIGTLMMLVVAAAAGSALFFKVRNLTGIDQTAGLRTDVPLLLLLAIGLTCVALGAWKEHSTSQILLQGTVACVGCLSLIWVSQAGLDRAIRYWFQASFTAAVVIPLLARRYVKAELPKGPRRDWWKKTCEAFFFAFLGTLLVSAGGLLQVVIATMAYGALKN